MTAIWPFVVIGLFSGSIYGLAAMGLVLTYKTSGIFNFAYGAVAMFCGFTFWQLRDVWHLSSWVALPAVLLVVAPFIGVVFERIFRPLAGVSAEIQIVVSLGLLAFLQAVVPLLYGPESRALHGIFPTSTFRLASRLNVGYDQLLTLVVSLGLGLALAALLRRTRLGMATRAVVDNRDLAELIGVSSEAVARVAWVISSVFAALVGILLSPSQGLDVNVLVLVVIYAFAPAVFGKLSSLPMAYAGAMALGVIQSVLGRWGSSGTMANLEAAIPYLALFAVLVAYGGRLKEVRSAFQRLPGHASGATISLRKVLTGWAALVAVGLVLPPLLSAGTLSELTSGVVFGIIALSLIVVTGWAGQISLAQFSFVGIGAFTAGHLAGADGSRFVLATVVGVLIAVPLGVLVGLPSLRLSGLYLALATMAFALLLDNLVFVRPEIGGKGYIGLRIPRPKVGPVSFDSNVRFYYLVLGVFAVLALGAALLRRGPVGRRLQAMRDAPLAISTLGVNLTSTKLVVFSLSAAVAAIGGALFGAMRHTVSPPDFGFQASLGLLLLVVFGGRSLVSGAVVAAAIYTIRLLPIPATAGRYIPLLIALGVINVAQYPEGIIETTRAQLRQVVAVFHRIPRPAAAAPPTAGRAHA
jgi:branched-chain amino acid transport system permease protein